MNEQDKETQEQLAQRLEDLRRESPSQYAQMLRGVSAALMEYKQELKEVLGQ